MKSEIGLRLAYWFGFAAVAGAFGGLIAFGVQHAHTSVENWRLLFIIEVRRLCFRTILPCRLREAKVLTHYLGHPCYCSRAHSDHIPAK